MNTHFSKPKRKCNNINIVNEENLLSHIYRIFIASTQEFFHQKRKRLYKSANTRPYTAQRVMKKDFKLKR